MKKHLLLIIAISLACLLAVACATTQTTGDSLTAFKSSPSWNKLDGRSKQAWSEAIKENDPERRLEALLKTVRPISAADKETLVRAGFDVRTVIKQIATGSVKAKDVPDVAQLKIVKVMELAVPMSLKK